jgi:hypothetical protein
MAAERDSLAAAAADAAAVADAAESALRAARDELAAERATRARHENVSAALGRDGCLGGQGSGTMQLCAVLIGPLDTLLHLPRPDSDPARPSRG